jgi:regulatory protein
MGEAVTSRDEVAGAVAFLLRSTQHRPQTEAELRAKLAGRDVPGDVAEAAMARALEIGAVDDTAFARAWVEDRGHRRGFGAARLREELRRRLLPEELIAQALGVLDERDDLATATELARRRFGQLPNALSPEAAARRLHAHLQRRGYPPDLARRVATSVSGLDRQWD